MELIRNLISRSFYGSNPIPRFMYVVVEGKKYRVQDTDIRVTSGQNIVIEVKR